MATIEVCAVCELPHPCPSGHNCGPLTREVPDEVHEAPEHAEGRKLVSKTRKNEAEVRGGESREEWDPSVTELPEQEPVVYEPGDILPADTEDGE